MIKGNKMLQYFIIRKQDGKYEGRYDTEGTKESIDHLIERVKYSLRDGSGHLITAGSVEDASREEVIKKTIINANISGNLDLRGLEKTLPEESADHVRPHRRAGQVCRQRLGRT